MVADFGPETRAREHLEATVSKTMSMDSELRVSQLLKYVLKREVVSKRFPTPLISLSFQSISIVVRYKGACWELNAFQNQVSRLKCLIICEVGLKLFPLLGDSMKQLSVGVLHQIPQVNKSSSQPQQRLKKRAKETTGDTLLL